MTPTQRPGVLHQTISDNVDVIVNTNTNQLIKRSSGRAKVFTYRDEDEVGFIINLITVTEEANIILN